MFGSFHQPSELAVILLEDSDDEEYEPQSPVPAIRRPLSAEHETILNTSDLNILPALLGQSLNAVNPIFIADFTSSYSQSEENLAKLAGNSQLGYHTKFKMRLFFDGTMVIWESHNESNGSLITTTYKCNAHMFDWKRNESLGELPGLDDSWRLGDAGTVFKNDFVVQDIVMHPKTFLLLAGGLTEASSHALRILDWDLERKLLRQGYQVKISNKKNFLPYYTYGSTAIAPLGRYNYITNVRFGDTYVVNQFQKVICSVKLSTSCFGVSDKYWVAFGTEKDGRIRLFKYKDDGMLKYWKSFHSHKYPITALAVTIDDLLVSGSKGAYIRSAIKVWNVRTKTLVYHIRTDGSAILKLISLPNNWICSMSNSSSYQIKVWNLKTQKIELEYSGNDVHLAAHEYIGIVDHNRFFFISVATRPHQLNSVVSRASHPTFANHLKFKLFYLYNLLRSTPDEALFSNCQINDAQLLSIIKMLSFSSTLTELDLSFNLIGNDAIPELAVLFKPDSSRLRSLNLSNNLLKYNEVAEIANFVKFSNSLIIILLRENIINLSKDALMDLKKDFKKSQSLKVVDISQNSLSEDCERMFAEYAAHEEGKPPETTFRYSMFQTSPRSVKSRISPDETISAEKWIVSLASPKTINHSIIFIEGMTLKGNVFISKYDIGVEDSVFTPTASVQAKKVHLPDFDRDKFDFQVFPVSMTRGNSLKRILDNEDGTKVKFSMFSSTSCSSTENCLKWAIRKLAEINITVKPGIFPTPVSYASGRGRFKWI
jgi:hypothetical protein